MNSSPITLRFKDPALEQTFIEWTYHQNPLYHSKIWSILAPMIFLYLILVRNAGHHSVPGQEEGESQNAVTPIMISSYVTITITFVCFGLLFVPRLSPYREYIVAVAVTSHWPVWVFFFERERSPLYLPHMHMLGCMYFCAFVSGVRFVFILWLLTIAPLVTLACSTIPFGYFSTHSGVEGVWLLPYLVCTSVAWSVERQRRRSFIERYQLHLHITELQNTLVTTRRVVSNLFPRFAVTMLLHSKPVMDHKVCILITDVRGFTQWSTNQSLDSLFRLVSVMFTTLERIGEEWDVERLCTLGDSFVGVVAHEGNHMTAPHVCSNALRAGLAMVGLEFESLRLRVGLAYGVGTFYFVGASPLQLDVTGHTLQTAKVLEQTGDAGVVHASVDVVRLIGALGEPEFEVMTATQYDGYYLSGWRNPPSSLYHRTYSNTIDQSKDEQGNLIPEAILKWAR
eukprot:PhF_6_TR37858/c0_g1_i1/m.56388